MTDFSCLLRWFYYTKRPIFSSDSHQFIGETILLDAPKILRKWANWRRHHCSELRRPSDPWDYGTQLGRSMLFLWNYYAEGCLVHVFPNILPDRSSIFVLQKVLQVFMSQIALQANNFPSPLSSLLSFKDAAEKSLHAFVFYADVLSSLPVGCCKFQAHGRFSAGDPYKKFGSKNGIFKRRNFFRSGNPGYACMLAYGLSNLNEDKKKNTIANNVLLLVLLFKDKKRGAEGRHREWLTHSGGPSTLIRLFFANYLYPQCPFWARLFSFPHLGKFSIAKKAKPF